MVDIFSTTLKCDTILNWIENTKSLRYKFGIWKKKKFAVLSDITVQSKHC